MIEGKFLGNKELTPSLFEHTFLMQSSVDFKAGQYFSLEGLEGETYGPFSLLSTPKDLPFVSFLSRHPLALKEQQRVRFSAPQGLMTALDLPSGNLFCLAGGTGIVPFISLINDHLEKDFTVLWSIKDPSDREIIAKYLQEAKNFTLLTHVYNESNLNEFIEMITVDQRAQYYLAGPYPFVEKIGDYLQESSISHLLSDMKKFR